MQLFIIILFATVMTMVETTDTVNRPINIAVVVDSYDSIGIENFSLVLRQISSTIQNQTLDPKNLFVGVLFYYANNFECVGLTDNKALLKMINEKEILYSTKTATDDINKIEGSMLDTIDLIFAQNTRPQAENRMVVITFGEYTDNPTSALELATEQNITVDVISIGNASQAYLMKVTGSTDRITHADNLMSVGSVLNNFFAKTIGGLKNELNSAVVERNKADIAILVDNPYIISKSENYTLDENSYNLILDKIISATIENQKIAGKNALIGFYLLLGSAYNWYRLSSRYNPWSFNGHKNWIGEFKQEAKDLFEIDDISWGKSSATIEDCISRTIEKILFIHEYIPWYGKDNRDDAADHLIVISFTDHKYNLSTSRAFAKSHNVTVHAIGIGNVSNNYLEKITGSPNNVIKTDSINGLQNTLNTLFNKITT